ncbi:MAG: UDP-N-acetylenolpyruvoylglucosamine reductase [Cyanobacteria bacterium RYN_339]|nr:UDP-N-acetylenolpyruvoylglucosamine reductase [Cyanobacteria bacterium RYN_339]
MNSVANVRQDVALAPFTTWQVGGPARYFLEPTTVEEIVQAVDWARAEGLPWTTIGRGSNLLVSDEGFPGLVVRLANNFAGVRFAEGKMHAQAGLALAQMVVKGLEHSLGGLEPMVGVPGTVGGAVAMNASAHHVEISKGFIEGRVLRPNGQVETWSFDDFRFQYRHTRLHDEQGLFLDGVWQLDVVDKPAGLARVRELQQWRNQKQPTNVPTGGSTFRNPGGEHPAAGALIELVGAKNLKVGGAEVSEKHANFIINRGGATAADIQALICELQTRVRDRFGVVMHPEVIGLGLAVGLPR